jgi:tRNA-specific 2-thiouridylase
MYYTIGQRQGLLIGGLKNHPEAPWYVAGKDLINNQLLAVQGKQHDLLFTHWLTSCDIFWINQSPIVKIDQAVSCKAKVRYRQEDQECSIIQDQNGLYTVSFSVPQRAITAGQSVVFYLDDICLGGGVIETTGK